MSVEICGRSTEVVLVRSARAPQKSSHSLRGYVGNLEFVFFLVQRKMIRSNICFILGETYMLCCDGIPGSLFSTFQT